MDELTDTQKAILDFERQWWKYAGAKESAVRERFGCAMTRYYQQLGAVIVLDAALAYDPLGVRRLRRIRDARRAERAGRRSTSR